MKVISAGVIIINHDNEVLLGHPTHQRWQNWNIPKGRVEDDETLQEAALREAFEETSLKYSFEDLRNHYHIPNYTKEKELHLYVINDSPKLSNIKCISYVNGDKSFPEFDKFAFVGKDKLEKYIQNV